MFERPHARFALLAAANDALAALVLSPSSSSQTHPSGTSPLP